LGQYGGMAKQKHPQNAVDRLLLKLSSDVGNDFLRLARHNSNAADMQRWLNEQALEAGLSDRVSVSSCQNWREANFPPAAQAQLVNALASSYAGTDASAALELALGIAAELLDKLFQQITPEKLEEASVSSLLYQSTLLLKEVRASAGALHLLETIRDRRALELAGAYRMAELLQDSGMADAVAAAIAQVESEV
jgi:hypothetical protein